MKKIFLAALATVLALNLLNSCNDDDFELPYKMYSSHLSQANQDAPIVDVIFNELDIIIEWNRISTGAYRGTISKPLDIKKTTLNFQLNENNKIGTMSLIDSVHIQIFVNDKLNAPQAMDGFRNATLEIKSFK